MRADKGADVLLDAYARLSRPPPLVMIGETWPDTPQPVPAGAMLLGPWPNAAVREAMRRCLALVAPSIWPEPFGIVVAEALTAGRPVVASAIGGIPEVVRDGHDGLLVAAADASALATALDRVISEPGLREALATRAAQSARRYGSEAVTHRFEDAYSRVVQGRS